MGPDSMLYAIVIVPAALAVVLALIAEARW